MWVLAAARSGEAPIEGQEALISAMVTPGMLARERAFQKWQAKDCPWWRRTPLMWGTLIRSE